MAGDYLNLEPTRIFGGEYISESSPSPSEPADPVDGVDELDSQGGNRDGRWVRLTPPIKEEPGKLKDDQPTEEPAPAENSGHTPLDMVHHLIHRPVIKYKTKTLWVTKVEKVLDTRVTATMEAKNCVPVNSHFPFCEHHEVEHHHGYHHHGYHHHGLHGGFHIGGVLSTNKVDGGVDGDAEESESQAVVVEAPAEVESEKLEDIESQVVETTEREVEVEDDRVEESNAEQVAE
ncbi:uncharacterized protein LOC128993811 [Macrosteles quadrilineatus]|uniref:uncharacterized protein LOC128993811 n=1 Tax=Macrosteles quadrilineatus TaxID=74068 RepID=UPI0023E276EB|nr:uncharacterized protein LOC128993811 [Macrosteles quadrilineatus]